MCVCGRCEGSGACAHARTHARVGAPSSKFKAHMADVLVCTDVAAKGLDFPDIQHVINFTMPREIENYVHRIGRTGRCGKTGVATTFINKATVRRGEAGTRVRAHTHTHTRRTSSFCSTSSTCSSRPNSACRPCSPRWTTRGTR